MLIAGDGHGLIFFGKFQGKFAERLIYKFPIRNNYCILLSLFAIINNFNRASEEHVKSKELEHGRSSEMLLLSPSVSENCPNMSPNMSPNVKPSSLPGHCSSCELCTLNSLSVFNLNKCMGIYLFLCSHCSCPSLCLFLS